MSTYFVEGCVRHLKDTDVSTGVKMAAAQCDYPSQGIPIDRVETHSLHTGGENSLRLNGYSDTEIKTMGRWRSDTFKEYIAEGLS